MLYDKRWETIAAPVKIEPWRQLLLQAALILERDGWCQGSLHQRRKSCAVGALQLASRYDPTTDDNGSYGEAYQRLRQFISTSGRACIESWNDRKGRTSAEVIATMRKVAGA